MALWGIIFAAGCGSPRPKAPNAHTPPATASYIEDLPASISQQRRTVVTHAIHSLGIPYRWGGSSPVQGFDCSGLVVYTHAKAGLFPPRTARAQFESGRKVTKASLRPGDLVFFDAPGKKTAFHVGIYVGKSNFVHAPGRGKSVRQATLENPYFKRYYRGARTFL
ncbi:MAG TPA: NlpC/P60 family protein [Desulfobacteraceae bacterium]|nr:NlpC/P60 family protein [Desulfobacteraceae bacterium]